MTHSSTPEPTAVAPNPVEPDPLALDGIVPLGNELDSSCPCCSVPLRSGSIDGRPALYCSQCSGVLMKCGAFGAVLRNRRATGPKTAAEDVPPVDPNELQRAVDCPRCAERMETHPYYGPGNVVIDSCIGCGLVWLDHFELSRLARVAGRGAPSW